MTFDDFSAGSGSTKETPDSESNDKDNINQNADADDDNFEDNSDEALKIILKQLGATSNDVKEVKVDLDLTKP